MLNAIKSADNILVVTGAGISTSSGIQAWRTGDDAVWANDVLEKGTQAYFNRNPASAWSWYLDKFKGVFDLKPNEAHLSLVDLETWCEEQGKSFGVITQNIDHLHKKAGSKNVIEIHGTSNSVRCPVRNCELAEPYGSVPMSDVWEDYKRFEKSQDPNDLPCCPKCETPYRAHALWFDELYSSHSDYRLDEAMEWLEECDVMIFTGTSFSVGITNMAVQAGYSYKADMYLIDPNPTLSLRGMVEIKDKAENYLPNLVRQLNND